MSQDTGKKSRRTFLAATGSAAASAIAGCAGGDSGGSGETSPSTDSTTATESTPTPKRGGSIKAGMGANKIQTLDPAMIDVAGAIQVASNVYNALIKYDASLKVISDLATDWTWNSDTAVEFTLREGVTFHNGEEMTAEDVKFSLERVLDEETGSPWRGKLKTITGIETKGSHTVILQLEKPFAPLESYLARRNMGGCIVPKKAVENGTDLSSNPIGTGPFSVDEWEKGSEIRLKKFENYWKDGKPYLDSVTLQMIPDETTLTTALEAGDVDIVNAVPNQSISRLKQKQEVKLHSIEGLNVRYLGFNTRSDNVFSDKKVRQAASLAISRANMVSVLGDQVFSENHTPVPKALEWAHTGDVPNQSQDKEKAKQLLEEAGATGEKISIKVWKGESWKKVANAARDMMNEVGFDAEVQVFEWGTFWNHVTKNADFDAFVLGWTGLTDPDGYLYSQFKTDGSWNWMDYSNEEVDSLLEKGRTETDREKRAEHYAEVQKIASEEAVYANVATQQVYQGRRASVKGYTLLPIGSFRFESVYVEE